MMIGRLHHVVIDCPDPARLASFYSELLGLPVTYGSPDWVVISQNDTTSGVAFQLAPNYRPLAPAFLLAALLALAAPVSRAGAAQPRQVAGPVIPQGKQLVGLACSSWRSCWTLDYNATVALHWDGTQWTSMSLSLPAAQIAALTCPSDSDCWAVGWSPQGANVIVHGNGHGWFAVPAPHPKYFDPQVLGTIRLNAVACAARTSCWAVGEYWANMGTFRRDWFNQILHWNGTAWSQVAVPQPERPHTGLYNRQLLSLACAGPRACWAVGQYTPLHQTASHALMLGWNGSRWSLVRNPLPTGSSDAALKSVTCPSKLSCIAVGGWEAARPPDAFGARALFWNGKAWRSGSAASVQALQSPQAPTAGSSASGVSCGTARDCWVLAQWSSGGF